MKASRHRRPRHEHAPEPGRSGILIEGASDTIVGGAGLGNSIRGNQGDGVWVFGANALRNRISRNEITSDGGEGIDLLRLDFEDPIDPGDSDEGPNRLQNSPEIESATFDAGTGQITIPYRVDTDPIHAAHPLTIEFFRTDDFDEGAVFLGSAEFTTADWAGGTPAIAAFTPSGAIQVGDSILATAPDADGNTSEFPADATLVAPEPGATVAGGVVYLALAGLRRRPRAVR